MCRRSAPIWVDRLASNRNSINNFLTSRDGVAATEFALILPVLVLILVSIITVGWIFYLRNNMETAARAGARSMAALETTIPPQNTEIPCSLPPGAGTPEKVACDSFVQMASADIRVHAVDCCSQIPDPVSLCPPENPIDGHGSLDDRAVVIRVEVDGSDAAILDIFGFFEGVVMSSTAEMRREEECLPPPP